MMKKIIVSRLKDLIQHSLKYIGCLLFLVGVFLSLEASASIQPDTYSMPCNYVGTGELPPTCSIISPVTINQDGVFGFASPGHVGGSLVSGGIQYFGAGSYDSGIISSAYIAADTLGYMTVSLQFSTNTVLNTADTSSTGFNASFSTNSIPIVDSKIHSSLLGEASVSIQHFRTAEGGDQDDAQLTVFDSSGNKISSQLPTSFVDNNPHQIDVRLPFYFNTEFARGIVVDAEVDNASLNFSHSLTWGGIVGITTADGTPVLNYTALGTDGTDWSQPYSPSTVPIPTAAWLFGSILLGLTGMARKRKAT